MKCLINLSFKNKTVKTVYNVGNEKKMIYKNGNKAFKLSLYYLLIIASISVLITGCKEDEDEDNKSDNATQTDSDSHNVDTNNDDTNGEGIDTEPDKEDVLIKEISNNLTEFEALAVELEARRLEVDLQHRDMLAKEQLLTGLEADAAQKHDELYKIKETVSSLTDKAAENIKKIEKQEQLKTEIKYNEEHKKLQKEWGEIQNEQKKFIASYFGSKDNLKPEVAKLKEERLKRISMLIKTVEGMRPASSASMITSMSTDDAVKVMRGISSDMSALILGSMEPEVAAALATGMLGPEIADVRDASDIKTPKGPAKQNSDKKTDEETEPTTEETPGADGEEN